MGVTAISGWGREYLGKAPGKVADLEPAEHFAIQQTLARYAFALDQHDLAALEQILTGSATWTFSIAGQATLGPVSGREAILDFVRGTLEEQADQRRHNLVNISVFAATTSTADAQAYLMLTSSADGAPSIIATGFAMFKLEKSESGWRIAELFLGFDNAM
jgi:ketosteroid isomerase-like protein